ncbi:nitrilase-related carbon-nitrogen hydrolase [Paraclostridium bifermentans]|nr:nitrilase-related carbon-nitrogen hydrolase [Paraclostridium bifermentans]
MVILPEMFCCPYETHINSLLYAEYENGDTFTYLSNLSKENNIYLVAGSMLELIIKIIFIIRLTYLIEIVKG